MARSFPVPKIDDYVLPIGKARIVKPGKDVTLVGYSISVGIAEEAAAKLAGEGIDAEVIDLRTLRPLDIETVVQSVKKTNRIVTVEQALAGLLGGFGSLFAGGAGGFRLSGRSSHQGHGQGRAHSLCRQSGEAGPAHRG